MKRLFASCFAVLVACTMLLAANVSAGTLPEAGALGPKEALQLMDTLKEKLTIIDVRTEDEYAQGHIPGAILLPVQTLQANMDKVPAKEPILIVCRTGRRAEAAYQMLREARPANHELWFLRGVPQYKSDGSFTFN